MHGESTLEEATQNMICTSKGVCEAKLIGIAFRIVHLKKKKN